jgi:putative glutamine amidotransferase
MSKHSIKQFPLILVSPSTQKQGIEFADSSISLSNRYCAAIAGAGGMPVVVPCTKDRKLVSEYVRRSNGLVLTGGDDVEPRYYTKKLPPKLAQKMGPTEPERDELELLLIEEVFRQRKPLLAICRGHQILNVALGGTLIVDIPTQVTGALDHRRMDKKCEPVHSVALTAGSDLAKVVGGEKLEVNSTHHQAIGKIATPLCAVAKSKDGIVEAMELKDKKKLPFMVSVQFHPERLCDRYKEFAKLFTTFVRACSANSR